MGWCFNMNYSAIIERNTLPKYIYRKNNNGEYIISELDADKLLKFH